jgi:hypothetical protein
MLHREISRTPTLLYGLTLMLCLHSAGWSDSFPRTRVQIITGSAFTFPDNLDAPTAILAVGFTQKAGANTKPWAQRLERGFTRADGFSVYPEALHAGVSPLFRGFALSSIRSGVTSQQSDRFLIVDHDESTWRTLAGYRMQGEPHIIVVDRAGTVLVRGRGQFDEKNYQDAAARIRSAAGSKS